MIQRVYTGNDAMTLKISVTTQGEQEIRLIIEDAEQANTILTDRLALVDGNFVFLIGLPLCQKYVNIIVVNESDGGSDNYFTYDGFEKTGLVKRMDIIDFSKYNLSSFIKFIQKFSYNAGVLRTNDPNNDKDYYRDDNWAFFIKYLPVIRDYETGQECDTPARISVDNGLIEISQKYFLNYTVPMRMACLLHEYSHPYVNENPDDESEADLNGLIIYLGLGYPRYEAMEVWCQVFENTDTEQNMERIAIIEKFIEDFDNNKIVFN